jgi:hypothetical protein
LTGTGGIHIDACRVPGVAQVPWGRIRGHRVKQPGGERPSYVALTKYPPPPHPLGRWPANLLLIHSPSCPGSCACVGVGFGSDGEPLAKMFPRFNSYKAALDWMMRLVTPPGRVCLCSGVEDDPCRQPSR